MANLDHVFIVTYKSRADKSMSSHLQGMSEGERVCLGREESASAGGGGSLQTAGSEVNHDLHLFGVEPVDPAQNVVEAGARPEVFENRGHRHARATLFVAAGFPIQNIS